MIVRIGDRQFTYLGHREVEGEGLRIVAFSGGPDLDFYDEEAAVLRQSIPLMKSGGFIDLTDRVLRLRAEGDAILARSTLIGESYGPPSLMPCPDHVHVGPVS